MHAHTHLLPQYRQLLLQLLNVLQGWHNLLAIVVVPPQHLPLHSTLL
jgi:hypothetical protein